MLCQFKTRDQIIKYSKHKVMKANQPHLSQNQNFYVGQSIQFEMQAKNEKKLSFFQSVDQKVKEMMSFKNSSPYIFSLVLLLLVISNGSFVLSDDINTPIEKQGPAIQQMSIIPDKIEKQKKEYRSVQPKVGDRISNADKIEKSDNTFARNQFNLVKQIAQESNIPASLLISFSILQTKNGKINAEELHYNITGVTCSENKIRYKKGMTGQYFNNNTCYTSFNDAVYSYRSLAQYIRTITQENKTEKILKALTDNMFFQDKNVSSQQIKRIIVKYNLKKYDTK